MSEIIKEQAVEQEKNCDTEANEEAEHDPHYDPIISLPEVVVPTLEEDETEMLCLRAKLYRYDASESPAEWKERGTGNVKILHHKQNETVRVVMRRDKTLKLCANHFILPNMVLQPNSSCDRAWVYSAKDFSDETVKTELLAIKFSNVENALKWKNTFEEAKKIIADSVKENSKEDDAEITKGMTDADNKIIIENSLALNDTFEEDKKISVKDKKEESVTISPKKLSNLDVSEKLSSMTIKSS